MSLTWLQGLNTSNAVTAFERMEEKVIALEAEAESTLQVRALRWSCTPHFAATPLHGSAQRW